MKASDNSQKIQIHLVIHQQDEDLHIDFPFDKMTDNIDDIVNELVDTLKMTEGEKVSIKNMIETQIYKSAPSSLNGSVFEPIGSIDPFVQPTTPSAPLISPVVAPTQEDSEEEDIQDLEYRYLLEQQRHELQNLLQRQLSEKRELAQRIAAETSFSSRSKRPTSPPPSSPPPSTNPNSPPSPSQSTSTSTSQETCDDLIVF